MPTKFYKQMRYMLFQKKKGGGARSVKSEVEKKWIMVYLEDIPYITFNLELVAEHDGFTPKFLLGDCYFY